VPAGRTQSPAVALPQLPAAQIHDWHEVSMWVLPDLLYLDLHRITTIQHHHHHQLFLCLEKSLRISEPCSLCFICEPSSTPAGPAGPTFVVGGVSKRWISWSMAGVTLPGWMATPQKVQLQMDMKMGDCITPKMAMLVDVSRENDDYITLTNHQIWGTLFSDKPCQWNYLRK